MTRIAVALAVLAAVSCPGTDPPPNKKTCNTVTDCSVDQHCSHGFCEANGAEGEGATGEGEGSAGEGEGDAVAAFCDADAACTGQSAATCIQQVNQTIDQLRAIGTQTCLDAIAANNSALTCASTQPCNVLQDQNLLAEDCPDVARVDQLVNECIGQPGEGEGELLQCPQTAGLDPASPTSTNPVSVNGNYDASVDPACSANGFGASASLAIALNGNSTFVTGGKASFDGVSNAPLQNLVAVDPVDLTATACARDQSSNEIALELVVVGSSGSSGANSDFMCGPIGVAAGEGEGEGGQ
jgi:hypothetical protein